MLRFALLIAVLAVHPCVSFSFLPQVVRPVGPGLNTKRSIRATVSGKSAVLGMSLVPADEQGSLRSGLRQITGFSFRAFRATMRATTGVSLTAISASARATTSVLVTKAMKWILVVFPTWFRYFLQPLLIFYYFPMLILRSMGPKTRSDNKAKLAAQMDDWRQAVKIASGINDEWPVYVDEAGYILGRDSSVDVSKGVLDSILVAKSLQQIA